MGNLVFITGGARSGKSRFAQARAETHFGPLLFVATALASDEEMVARIQRHRDDRGPRWATLEDPFDWVDTLAEKSQGMAAILVDCITLWTSQLLVDKGLGEGAILASVDAAIVAMRQVECPVYLVSNEVGQGIVPAHELARRFRDVAGRVNQRLAAAAAEAWVLFAGLPLRLK